MLRGVAMIWQIRIFLIAVIALVLFFLGVRYNEALEDAEEYRLQNTQLKVAAAAQADTIATLHNERAILEAVLKEKESYEVAIQKQLGGVHRKLNDLLKDDPVAQEWHTAPLPDGIRAVLQDDGVRDDRKGDVRAPVKRVDGADSRPSNSARSDRK